MVLSASRPATLKWVIAATKYTFVTGDNISHINILCGGEWTNLLRGHYGNVVGGQNDVK